MRDNRGSFGGKRKSFGGPKGKSFGGPRGKSFGGPKREGFGGPKREGFGGPKREGFGGPKREGFGGPPGDAAPKRPPKRRFYESGPKKKFEGKKFEPRKFDGSQRRFDGPRDRAPKRDVPPQDFSREDARPPAESNSRFVFGVNPALEALRARPKEIERLYYADGAMTPTVAGEILSRASDAKIRFDVVPREKLNFLAEGGVHQGVVLEMREFQYSDLSELLTDPGVVVVLDSLQDPMNVGAIIRSAHAFGAKGIVMAKDRAAAITGSVVKASAGATEHTKIVRVTNLSRALEELKEAGYWTVAADPEGQPLSEAKLDGPLAVVIGAEGPGVRKGVLEHCDFKLRIPMLGKVASLNASVSAGVLLYEIGRQREARAAVVKS